MFSSWRTAIAGLVLVGGCGSGRLDPFDKSAIMTTQPGEDCSAVDTDPTENLAPPALESTPRVVGTTITGEFQIDWAEYPLPYPNAHVWATWSKGLIATANGKYYSALGDGNSPGDPTGDGNTFLYEYDPATKILRAVGDILTAFGTHVPGENGYGKVQGQIGEGPCSLLYFHSYWGSNPDKIVYGGNYLGDLLLRYNPWTKELKSLGVKIPGMGVPSMTTYRKGGLIYAEANTPPTTLTDPSKDVVFWVYDIRGNSVVFQSPRRQRNDRNIAVAADGSAYYSGLGSDLYRYNPATNSEGSLGVSFRGGGWIRASTRVATDGTITMLTAEPSEAYRFEPSSLSLTLLAALPSDAADVDLDPTEKVAYFVPNNVDATSALPLYQLNRTDGTLRNLIDLAATIEAAGGSRPRGSYSINVSRDGRSIYVPINSGANGFGIPIFAIVHLSESALP